MTRAPDTASFADLYEENFDRIYAYVAKRLRDRAAAQDVTSDVFHHALANLQNYEPRGIPFAAWLFRIAANKVYDHRQKQYQEQKLPPPNLVDQQADYEEAEQTARLFAAVRRLPADQRRVIEMRFVDQKSIRVTAEELRRSEGAVKQLQLRAIEALRASLGEVSHG
ncbi:MAG TPA: sigma-70 family RNA polymerase sigma factor [Bryobacteraceae bacterium]|nr:sigma-70 family RNA polymerase sigma factor [Bryobacteraceae bacterium]